MRNNKDKAKINKEAELALYKIEIDVLKIDVQIADMEMKAILNKFSKSSPFIKSLEKIRKSRLFLDKKRQEFHPGKSTKKRKR